MLCAGDGILGKVVSLGGLRGDLLRDGWGGLLLWSGSRGGVGEVEGAAGGVLGVSCVTCLGETSI